MSNRARPVWGTVLAAIAVSTAASHPSTDALRTKRPSHFRQVRDVLTGQGTLGRNEKAPAAASADSHPDHLRIAFWNLRDLSSRSRNDQERRAICKIISDEAFDAVAVCEVNDTTILEDLAVILTEGGQRWRSVTSEKVGNSTHSSESYGVLYNDEVLEVYETRLLPRKLLKGLDIGDVGIDAKLTFDRAPYAVTLGTDDGRFDLALVIVHVTWGKTVAPRIAEVRALHSYYDEVFKKEHDVLVGGDFNRNVGDEASLVWLTKRSQLADTTSPSPPTVIQGKSTYDHIMLNPSQTTEYHNVHGVVEFDQTVFNGDIRAAKKAVSDHRPVWVELTVPPTDDD